MMNLKKGVLIQCDPAKRQLLVHLDLQRSLGTKFVTKNLDVTHMFVDRQFVSVLEQKIDHLMDLFNAEL